ncbi:MAG: type II toxin-antitoxin system HicA family toxin [Bryobacterales bacterium]|nr:type II toxin-antitoxin system HicA family toxin [Bryobacterales bacterium]
MDRHQPTLEAILEKRANIPWAEIESMLRHFGAEISEGRGSRVRISLRGIRAVFHRPHPQKETNCGAVASMRRFLVEADIKPGGLP